MAGNWSVEQSAAAVADIADIAEYLAAHDGASADRFAHSVNKAVDRLREYPRSGTRRDALAHGLRSISLRPFVMFYRLVEHDRLIQIARVVDARRDLAGLDLHG